MERSFSATVQSFSVDFTGKEAHASEPENGINPAFAVSKLITAFAAMEKPEPLDLSFCLLTPIHINLGEKNYGISPSKATMHYTARTWTINEMKSLKARILKLIQEVTEIEGLTFEVDWFEYFPAGINDPYCNSVIIEAAEEMKLMVTQRKTPFKFGEDFGHFAISTKGGMFGLGAGEQCPALHHDSYDFPDQLISTGIGLFAAILKQVLK